MNSSKRLKPIAPFAFNSPQVIDGKSRFIVTDSRAQGDLSNTHIKT